MKKYGVFTEKACKPASFYSQAIVVDDWVFVSGQGALDLDGRILAELGMKEQTKMAMDYIKIILEHCGSSMDHVVKITAHIADYSLFGDFNEIYQEYFSTPYPARTTVVSGLAPGMLVEVDAIAKLTE